MKVGQIAASVLMIGGALALLGAKPISTPQDWHSAGSRNEEFVLRYLRPALNSIGKSGRIYYRGTCKERGWDPIQFPNTDVQLSPKGMTDLDKIRGMFRNDGDVRVTEQRPGIIRIDIGKVSAAILQTKISLLELSPVEQYNPAEAINAIEHTKYVQNAMQRLGVSLVPIFLGLEVSPSRGLPHLPSSMKDVTFDKALDTVASTFRGIIVYGECPQTGVAQEFYVGFAGLVGFDDMTLSDIKPPQSSRQERAMPAAWGGVGTRHPQSGCCKATLVGVGEPEANQRLMEFPALAVNLRALLVNVLKTKRS